MLSRHTRSLCYTAAAGTTGRGTVTTQLALCVRRSCYKWATKGYRGETTRRLCQALRRACYTTAAGRRGRGEALEGLASVSLRSCYRMTAGHIDSMGVLPTRRHQVYNTEHAVAHRPRATIEVLTSASPSIEDPPISPDSQSEASCHSPEDGRRGSRTRISPNSRKAMAARRLLVGLRSASISFHNGMRSPAGLDQTSLRLLPVQEAPGDRSFTSTTVGSNPPSPFGATDSCVPSEHDEEQIFYTTQFVAGPDVTKVGLSFNALPPQPMIVRQVGPGSWAETVGVQAGDQLIELNGAKMPVVTVKAFREAMRQRPLQFKVRRLQRTSMRM